MDSSPQPLPVVAILAEKFVKGCANLADAVDPLIVADFTTAFTSHYQSDAHFVTYQVTGLDAWPRLTKPILPKIRLMQRDVVASMIVLDFDNPGHAKWEPGAFDAFLGQLADLGSRWPLAMQWTLLYATRGGARVVYVLKEPCPVDRVEQKHAGLVQTFNEHGIKFDGSVWDWTRCFRFPFVTRDNRPSWLDPEGENFIEQMDSRVDVEDIPSAGTMKQNEYAEIQEFTYAKPNTDRCRALLNSVNATSGRMGATDFLNNAKKRLRGRDCYSCLFEHKSMAEVGARGSTMLKHVGQAISLLYYLEGTTPEHIYALFLPAVEQFEAAPDVPDWTEELWRMVGRNWMREDAKHQIEVAKAEEAAVKATTLVETMLDGMREWCHHPDLLSTDAARCVPFLERHLIASIGNSIYVMDNSGRYDPSPLTTMQLVAAIRSKGLDGVINTTTMNRDGALMDRPAQAILNEYATVAQEVHAVPQLTGSIIEDLDTHQAVLKVPCFGRSDSLRPQYDRDVDEWLQSLFEENYDIGCKWIAWALAFDEGPICALSLAGAAGVGKKMLVQGLAECLRSPRLAGAEDLLGNFNYGLLSSPFLVVNEGWPTGSKAARHPADSFRALVAGDPMLINRKFMAPVQVVNPVRVIFTANNLDVVKMLCARRELSPEDREALAIRLLHLDVSESASNYLVSKGGMKFTSSPGRRWIRGDGGGDSNYIVAKHFLYLYETRRNRGATGSRFLVEGNANQELLFEMRTQSGSSPLVIEAIIRMLEWSKKATYPGFAVVDNRIFALTSEVQDFYRSNMAQTTRETLTISQIANVFRGICLRDREGPWVLRTRESMASRRWAELDAAALYKVARESGYQCGRLGEIVLAQAKDLQGGIKYADNKSVRVNIHHAA